MVASDECSLIAAITRGDVKPAGINKRHPERNTRGKEGESASDTGGNKSLDWAPKSE